jgi:CDP-diacylglycerol---glycerol-3-phosphate 3-phosphatidyltransferase
MLPTVSQTDYSPQAPRGELPVPAPTAEPSVPLIVPRESRQTPEDDIVSQLWNVPNSLTLFRIFLVPFLVVVMLTKFSGKEYAGLAIFLVAAVTDFFDGFIARRTGQITRLGTLLDPIADKLLISAALISLVELGLAPAWMIVIIIGREFAVSGLRSIAAQQGVTIAASPLGKGKTISQVITIAILLLGYEFGEFLPIIGKVGLWIVMLFALASGIDYFLKFSSAVLRGRAS